jgi:hypothetical protein
LKALTVEAESPDGGTLSYQWYKAGATAAGDTAVSGATGKSYTPSTTDVPNSTTGEYSFYVIVTNTKNGGTNTTKSATVKVTVNDPATTPTDYVVDLNGQTTKNAAAFSGQYGSGFVIDLGTSFDYTLYEKWTIKAKFTNADGTQNTPSNGDLQMKYHNGVVTNANGGNVGTMYNFGVGGVTDASGITTLTSAWNGLNADATTVRMFGFQNSGSAGTAFVEIIEIMFEAKPAPVAPGAPINIVLTGEPKLKTTSGDITKSYDGLSVKLNLPSSFNPRAYNKIDFVVIGYDDDACTTVSTTTGTLATATLFTPWAGYDSGDFPAYGSAGRLQAIPVTTASGTGTGSSVTLALNGAVPEGFRVEVASKDPYPNDQEALIFGLEIVSIKFWHTDYQ